MITAKPGCHLQFQGRRIPLEPRSAVLIPEDTVFDCCGPVSTSHLWIHFTVSRPGAAIRRQPLVMAMDHILISLVDELIALHTRPEAPARDYQLHHHSAALLHIVFSRIDAPIPPTIPDRLLQVIDLIHHAPHGDLSNPFLATSAGMSVERFIRTFREHTGHTPAAYVIATRIKAAEVALALTDKTIDQIAAECGFPNRHYFSRVFARQIGCGPAEFRVRQRERKGR